MAQPEEAWLLPGQTVRVAEPVENSQTKEIARERN